MQHLGSTLVQLQISNLRKKLACIHNPIRHHEEHLHRLGQSCKSRSWWCWEDCQSDAPTWSGSGGCSMMQHVCELCEAKVASCGSGTCEDHRWFLHFAATFQEKCTDYHWSSWNIRAPWLEHRSTQRKKRGFLLRGTFHQSQRLNRALLALLQCDPKLGAGFHRADSTARLEIVNASYTGIRIKSYSKCCSTTHNSGQFYYQNGKHYTSTQGGPVKRYASLLAFLSCWPQIYAMNRTKVVPSSCRCWPINVYKAVQLWIYLL